MSQQSQETVVVPREPTEEMLNAAAVLLSRNALPKNWPGLHKLYRAMIAAAPASPDPLLEEAVGLLAPFARECEGWPELSDDDTLSLTAPDGTASAYDITYGQIRRARVFLAKLGGA